MTYLKHRFRNQGMCVKKRVFLFCQCCLSICLLKKKKREIFIYLKTTFYCMNKLKRNILNLQYHVSYFLFSFKVYRILILGCFAYMLLRIYAMYLICYSSKCLVNDLYDIFVKSITALRNDYLQSKPLYDKGFFQLQYRAMVHFSIKKVETTFE